MGKAFKWFRSLLTSKNSPESSPAKKKKSKSPHSNLSNSSVNYYGHVPDHPTNPHGDGTDANKHAIAVAAATAAVAEAALAAAQAAAQVVRLTSGGSSGRTAPYVVADRRSVCAAVKIQSAFRAYLARRALRALKGLVKLQALVRGHIVRKQSADMLFRMQTMARIQARASANRSEPSNGKINFTNYSHGGSTNFRKYEERQNSMKHGGGSLPKQNYSRSNIGNTASKESPNLASIWLNQWMEQCTQNNLCDDDERSDKILEIDTWNPQESTTSNDWSVPTSHYFSSWNDACKDHSKTGSSNLRKPNPSVSSEEVSSVISSKFPPETTENSPKVHPATFRRPSTPARSECSKSLFGDYIGHPSYMAYTQSSRAKVRSHSAPKQRMQYEELKFSGDAWDAAFAANRKSNGYGYPGQVTKQSSMSRHRF